MTMPPELSPMLCESAKQVPEDEGWTIEPKFDGWRGIAHITDQGVKLYSGRNGADYTGKLPYIEAELAACVPPGTVVDGEIIAAVGGCGAVQSVMARNEVHQPGALSPALSLVVFDLLHVRDMDLRQLALRDRRAMLAMIDWQAHVMTTPVGEACKAAHMGFLELGMEGSVCKRADSRYVNGRSRSWIKVKLEETIDAEVIGFKPGEGGRAGRVGALEVQLPASIRDGITTSVRTTVGSGLTDAHLADIDAHPEDWRGKTVEIKHNGVLKSGKVRHPVFLRRRDDLDQPAPVNDPGTAASRPQRTRAPRSGPWMRNYGAMNAEKAERSLRELRGGYGEAYERCTSRGGDVAAHIAKCEARCRALGVTV